MIALMGREFCFKSFAAVIFFAATVVTGEKFYTPGQDMEELGGSTRGSLDLPDVLLIGDSISIGYTEPTKELLKDVANVQRVKTNCGDTNSGLRNLENWLGDTKWDVIHFNWGLHDLCYRHPDSKVYGNRDKVKGKISVPIEQYKANLKKLISQLEKTGADLIWASTTIVPEGEAGRFVGDEIRYNAAAAKIMQMHGIVINDLHALSVAFGGEYSQPGDVHFSSEGSRLLAEQVSEIVRSQISE